MVYSEQEEFIRFILNDFQEKTKHILDKINVILEKTKQKQEFEYIQKEIKQMSKDFNFNPTYLSILNELYDIDITFINNLYEEYQNFSFCKSIIKEKQVETHNNLSEESINFIKDADAILDLIISNIINLYKKDKKDKNIFLLQKIKREIEKMEKILNSKIYTPEYPRVISDGWSFDKDINDKLIKLNYQYLKLI